MYKLAGVFQILAGLALWALTISLEISWLAFCFGTVIIGVLLLFFAPYVLLFPLAIAVPANGLLFCGLARLINRKTNGLGGL